jgi:hypothetical protein
MAWLVGGLVLAAAGCLGPPEDPAEHAVVASSEQELKRAPCASTEACAAGQHCTTEDGDCRRPPGCRRGQPCADVCFGVCKPNHVGRCRRDADCRTFSDLCTGCDCRALSVRDPDPVCPGPGVQCLIDPCFNQQAFCDGRVCALRTTN